MAALARTAQSNTPWGLVLISGSFSALIGLFLLSWPGVSLVAIVQLVGLFWLVDGILHLVGIFSDSRQWGWKLVGGVLGVLAGLVVLQHPLLSALLVPALLTSLLGVVGLVIGAIGLAIGLAGGGWGPAIRGALSFLLGLALLVNPLIGVAVLPFVLGVVNLVGGIAAIAQAFRMRSSGSARESSSAAA